MLKKNKFLIKSISASLSLAFFLSDISYAGVEVFPSSPTLSPIETISRDLSRFEAPLEFSSLQEWKEGSPDKPILIHIQDAHSNYLGQVNLSKTLDFLIQKYGVSQILVEGSAIDSTLTPLRELIPAEECKRVSKSLLLEGQIAGEEYLNLTSPHDMKILGIEDQGLYFQSLRSYADLADKRKAILKYLAQIQSSLEKLKKKYYPQELLDYEKEVAGSTEVLLTLCQKQGISLKDFPNLEKIELLKIKEKKIDFNHANLEQSAILQKLQDRGRGEEIARELEKMNKTKSSKAAQFSLFQNILNIAKENNISLKDYPGLTLYGDYLKEFNQVEIDKLLDEMQKTEDQVYLTFLKEDDSRLIHSVDRYLKLLETAYRIQMTSKDFKVFQINEPDFSTVSYLAFINRKLVDLGFFQDLISVQDILGEGRKSLVQFYDSVSKRDEAFLSNAKRLAKKKDKAIILISGGYHTQHLKELFQKEGYGYIVLAPIVTQETNQEKYEKLLLSPIKKESKIVEVGQDKTNQPSLSLLEKDLTVNQKGNDGIKCQEVMARFVQNLKDPGVMALRRAVPERRQSQLREVIEGRRQSAARLASVNLSQALRDLIGASPAAQDRIELVAPENLSIEVSDVDTFMNYFHFNMYELFWNALHAQRTRKVQVSLSKDSQGLLLSVQNEVDENTRLGWEALGQAVNSEAISGNLYQELRTNSYGLLVAGAPAGDYKILSQEEADLIPLNELFFVRGLSGKSFGEGLGLSMTRRRLEEWGGRIEAHISQSSVQFDIRLPLIAKRDGSVAEQSPAQVVLDTHYDDWARRLREAAESRMAPAEKVLQSDRSQRTPIDMSLPDDFVDYMKIKLPLLMDTEYIRQRDDYTKQRIDLLIENYLEVLQKGEITTLTTAHQFLENLIEDIQEEGSMHFIRSILSKPQEQVYAEKFDTLEEELAAMSERFNEARQPLHEFRLQAKEILTAFGFIYSVPIKVYMGPSPRYLVIEIDGHRFLIDTSDLPRMQTALQQAARTINHLERWYMKGDQAIKARSHNSIALVKGADTLAIQYETEEGIQWLKARFRTGMHEEELQQLNDDFKKAMISKSSAARLASNQGVLERRLPANLTVNSLQVPAEIRSEIDRVFRARNQANREADLSAEPFAEPEVSVRYAGARLASLKNFSQKLSVLGNLSRSIFRGFMDYLEIFYYEWLDRPGSFTEFGHIKAAVRARQALNQANQILKNHASDIAPTSFDLGQSLAQEEIEALSAIIKELTFIIKTPLVDFLRANKLRNVIISLGEIKWPGLLPVVEGETLGYNNFIKKAKQEILSAIDSNPSKDGARMATKPTVEEAMRQISLWIRESELNLSKSVFRNSIRQYESYFDPFIQIGGHRILALAEVHDDEFALKLLEILLNKKFIEEALRGEWVFAIEGAQVSGMTLRGMPGDVLVRAAGLLGIPIINPIRNNNNWEVVEKVIEEGRKTQAYTSDQAVGYLVYFISDRGKHLQNGVYTYHYFWNQPWATRDRLIQLFRSFEGLPAADRNRIEEAVQSVVARVQAEMGQAVFEQLLQNEPVTRKVLLSAGYGHVQDLKETSQKKSVTASKEISSPVWQLKDRLNQYRSQIGQPALPNAFVAYLIFWVNLLQSEFLRDALQINSAAKPLDVPSLYGSRPLLEKIIKIWYPKMSFEWIDTLDDNQMQILLHLHKHAETNSLAGIISAPQSTPNKIDDLLADLKTTRPSTTLEEVDQMIDRLKSYLLQPIDFGSARTQLNSLAPVSFGLNDAQIELIRNYFLNTRGTRLAANSFQIADSNEKVKKLFKDSPDRFLSKYKTSNLPSEAVLSRTELKPIKHLLLLVAESRKGRIPLGVTATKYADMNITGGEDGRVLVQLLEPGTQKVLTSFVVHQKMLKHVMARYLRQTRQEPGRKLSPEALQVQSALKDERAQDSVSRILLNQQIKNLKIDKHVLIRVQVKDIPHMKEEIAELKAQLERASKEISGKLHVYIELIDEGGNRLEAFDGLSSDKIPGGVVLADISMGVLSQLFIDKAASQKSGLLAFGTMLTGKNHNVYAYKAAMRTAILTAISDREDAGSARAIQMLTRAKRVSPDMVDLVKSVPEGATEKTYSAIDLVIKPIEVFSADFWEAYQAARWTASAA